MPSGSTLELTSETTMISESASATRCRSWSGPVIACFHSDSITWLLEMLSPAARAAST
jgi:hypothetical protein